MLESAKLSRGGKSSEAKLGEQGRHIVVSQRETFRGLLFTLTEPTFTVVFDSTCPYFGRCCWRVWVVWIVLPILMKNLVKPTGREFVGVGLQTLPDSPIFAEPVVVLFFGTGVRVALSRACGAVSASPVHPAPVSTHPATSASEAESSRYSVLTEGSSVTRAALIGLATMLALARLASHFTGDAPLAPVAMAIDLELCFDTAALTLRAYKELSALDVVGSHCGLLGMNAEV